MIICGIKITHDGAIALIDNGKLIFSYEMEKINNNHRHKEFCLSMPEIEKIFNTYGYSVSQIDKWVLDGWRGEKHGDPCVFKGLNFLNGNQTVDLELAKYGHLIKDDVVSLEPKSFTLPQVNMSYDSYLHVTSHILAAYCSSPFAEKKEDSFVLIWDGGMPPQLFYYKYENNEIISLGPLMYMFGSIYVDFPHEFEPYCNYEKHMSIAGKLMAYIALGETVESIVTAYRKIYDGIMEGVDEDEITPLDILDFTAKFVELSKAFAVKEVTRDKDMLTSLHSFLEQFLIENLEKSIEENPEFTKNLCFSGGSALNIKWNSAIRASKVVDEMWIPPFPNDSGNAIGVACCAMVYYDNIKALDWNVYCGPSFKMSSVAESKYTTKSCSLEELATIIHETNEPILFLNGRAELGPRALGNRSILSAPTSHDMKSLLNEIKIREGYRPIAPICLEEDAPKVFNPGTPDPYMLFQHIVRDEWRNKVPAIVHLDGSSRLQTVNKNENKEIHELLSHYKKLSGVPLLCNTSANLKGVGFFPDLKTAIDWGRINCIWSDGVLYSSKLVEAETIQTK